MVTLLLGGILAPISSLLGLIMNAIYSLLHLVGIQNIALSIFVFTFIVKTLMLPLNIKQQKFSRISSKMNPELQKIQAKYKGKTDEASIRKLREEQQAVYHKYGTSQASGCLPLLITLPILFALYSVIQNVPGYVTEVRKPYNEAAVAIIKSEEVVSIDEISADVLKLANTDASQGNLIDEKTIEKYKLTIKDYKLEDTSSVINELAKYNTKDWDNLVTLLKLKKDAVDQKTDADLTTLEIDDNDRNQLQESYTVIDDKQDDIRKINKFMVFDITNTPGWGFPGILIPLISMALSYVQGRQLNVKTKEQKDNPAAGAMASMNVVMPIMSGFFALMLPIGVGLYWIATSIYTIIQQFFVNKYIDKLGVDELIEKSVEKAGKKYAGKTTASSQTSSIKDLAMKQTKSINTTVSEKANSPVNTEGESKEEPAAQGQSKGSSGSISEIANLLKNRNYEKGDK